MRYYDALTIDPIKTDVEKVECEEIKGGYRYTAHYKDGSKAVIRAKATRKYLKAFLYNGAVASGKSGQARYWSYGKNPAAYSADNVIGVYLIQEAK